MEEVILVDRSDGAIGTMEKMEAHRLGLLHRAFSVIVFNSKGQMLLQQRALEKYHSGGLWSNTCCSHPRPGEELATAAARRLKEEMGLNLNLEKKFSFIYKTPFGNGLTEHEFDHVFFGYGDQDPTPNSAEVLDFKWEYPDRIREEIKKKPEAFSSWFKILMDEVLEFKAKTAG